MLKLTFAGAVDPTAGVSVVKRGIVATGPLGQCEIHQHREVALEVSIDDGAPEFFSESGIM